MVKANCCLFRIFFMLVLFVPIKGQTQDFPNLSEIKDSLRAFYNSGRNAAVIEKELDAAWEKITRLNISPNTCAVFDVDETVLDNYTEIERLDFGYEPTLWDNWIYSAKAPALQPVKQFYEKLQAMHIKIVFLTGRSERHYSATLQNLKIAGYTGFDTLIVKQEQGTFGNLAEYKKQSRLELQKAGYQVVICVGDQESDFVGFTGPVKVKIPNYIYTVN